jgi:molybdopterin-guanine dinucleotide biosynthesis protein MobB
MQAIAVVGTKKSGKTTTTENLIRELTKRGYNVAAIKHIPEPDFTIDTPGKDTWRYAQAGAKTVISVAANEVTTIEKVSTSNLTLEKLLNKSQGNDIVLIEGLKKLVNSNKEIPKIVVVNSKTEVTNALKTFKPILAFSGSYSTDALETQISYANGFKNPQKLAVIVEKAVLKK